MSRSTRPGIALIGCGGTISTLAADPRDSSDYVDTGRKIGLAEVLRHMPRLAVPATIRALDMPSVSSSAMGPEQWSALRHRCRALVAEEGCNGIVILHGTGTMEEAAWFLQLTLSLPVPIVLTGAQRPLSFPGGDAAANLAAALVAVGAGALSGVTICMNGDIHSAQQARKLDTYALDAFHSPGAGPLGRVMGDHLVLDHPVPKGGAFAGWDGAEFPRVDIIPCHAGSDDMLIRASVASGARGLVVSGFAPGLATPSQRAALSEAVASGVTVVQASRAISGAVLSRPSLSEAGIATAGTLDPYKSRILLALCLATAKDGSKDAATIFAQTRDAIV